MLHYRARDCGYKTARTLGMHGIVVGESLIDSGGLGLFVTDMFQNGMAITGYSGDIVTQNEAVKLTRCGLGSHLCTALSMCLIINGDRVPIFGRHGGSFVNHSDKHANADLCKTHNTIYIRALRDIYPGEEVLVSYGRYNKKIHEYDAIAHTRLNICLFEHDGGWLCQREWVDGVAIDTVYQTTGSVEDFPFGDRVSYKNYKLYRSGAVHLYIFMGVQPCPPGYVFAVLDYFRLDTWQQILYPVLFPQLQFQPLMTSCIRLVQAIVRVLPFNSHECLQDILVLGGTVSVWLAMLMLVRCYRHIRCVQIYVVNYSDNEKQIQSMAIQYKLNVFLSSHWLLSNDDTTIISCLGTHPVQYALRSVGSSRVFLLHAHTLSTYRVENVFYTVLAQCLQEYDEQDTITAVTIDSVHVVVWSGSLLSEIVDNCIYHLIKHYGFVQKQLLEFGVHCITGISKSFSVLTV